MEWFDQWLKAKDTPLLSKPPVRVFVMGANRWIEEREWPPARARVTPFYLESRKAARTRSNGDGHAGAQARRARRRRTLTCTIREIPCRREAARSAATREVFPWGPMDQRPVERRQDVLVYSTAPLKQERGSGGPIRVMLYASTSARDTDFTAKLVDVMPTARRAI